MKIQINSAGYGGQSTSLMGVLDERSGVLVIAKEISFREARIAADVALVTNMDLPDLDFSFSEKQLSETIRQFFTREGQGLLDIVKQLERHNPRNKIEQDGLHEGGMRYRIQEDITNGQMAVLMAVAFVENQKPINAMIEATNELFDFYTIQTI